LYRSEYVERRRRSILQRLQQLDRHADGRWTTNSSADTMMMPTTAATDSTALAVMSARAPG
jgi:hypothetical protein